MTPEAQRLADECKRLVDAMHAVTQLFESTRPGVAETMRAECTLACADLKSRLDRLASLIPAGGLAEEAGPAPAKIPTLAEKPAYATSTRGRADPLYAMACQVVRASKRGSISLVQRHLRIGYNRAAGLLEAMVGDVIAEMPPTTKIIKLPAAMAASIPLQEGDHDGNGY